jgi:flagellin
MNAADFSYDNLMTKITNQSASESAIRDVDMASEMVTFTKTQIMLQAGTAMLAQANSSSQTILSLFR